LLNESLLVNTLGHTAGVFIFGIFLFLLLTDRASARLRGSRPSILAAGLALVWNLASLVVLSGVPDRFADWFYLIGFSSLSLLPAVLLDLCLLDRYRNLVRVGYGISAVAIGLHSFEFFQKTIDYHRIGLQLITGGFGALAVVAAALVLRSTDRDRRNQISRIIGTMALFLFAMSFFHLGAEHMEKAWSQELAFHHAGIPLALIVLLQDYRFVLMDAFLRFLANFVLAVGFTLAAAALFQRVRPLDAQNGFEQAMLLVGACLLFILFALLRVGVQSALTKLFFRRPDRELLGLRLKSGAAAAKSEDDLIHLAASEAASFFNAETVPVTEDTLLESLRELHLTAPVSVSQLGSTRETLEQAGVNVIVPLRLSGAVDRFIFLGRRQGGRRYLSEDLQVLSEIAVATREQIEHYRESELRQLVSQAELRALQSQINPHFLFNAFNTLYGVIPREAKGARQTVLNLADLFRYFLRPEKSLLPFEEELKIIQAYLEIERLRLGDRLRVELDVDPQAAAVRIPILSVEPLIENAVKHGVARSAEGGLVRLEAHVTDEGLRISVLDTGAGFSAPSESQGAGVGLENVTRRLELFYGSGLEIDSQPGHTRVSFLVPASKLAGVPA
jgi:two-component system LytT family sensor kinase